jgi:hypothetical protein
VKKSEIRLQKIKELENRSLENLCEKELRAEKRVVFFQRASDRGRQDLREKE